MKGFLLGVDYGGSSVKATLLDEAGSTVAIASEEYKTYYPRESWVEHNPEELYDVFCKVIHQLIDRFGVRTEAIEALAISAGSQSGIYLDECDRPVRNSIYWADMRAVHYAEKMKREHLDFFFEKTANQPTASRTINQLMWMRDNEPENFVRIRKVMFTKDYIRYRLTGDFVTDYIDAMGSHLMDVGEGCWSDKLCGWAGISTDMLPGILTPTDIVGPITEKACQQTGLSARTKVIVGSTDTVMETYANGAIHEGDTIVKVATAGRIISITKRPVLVTSIVNYKHVIPGYWYPGTGRGGCATSYRWFRDVLGDMEMLQAKNDRSDPYELLNQEAEAVPPGSDGLFFMPYLNGSNVEPNRRAGFIGLRADHTKGHFVRAVLEGVGYAMKEDMNTMRQLNMTIRNPVLIGGASKGSVWPQIMADMLNIELGLTKNGDSSLGSAMLAGVATGVFTSFEESVRMCVCRCGCIQPNHVSAEVYEKGFEFHERFVHALDPIYRESGAAK